MAGQAVHEEPGRARSHCGKLGMKSGDVLELLYSLCLFLSHVLFFRRVVNNHVIESILGCIGSLKMLEMPGSWNICQKEL